MEEANGNAIHCRILGNGAQLHHVGLAVESIQAVCPSCQPFVEESQGVSLAFIELHGLAIELLEPLGDDSPIARSLRDGIKLLHLCYEVPDLDESLKHSTSVGFHRISRTACAPAFGNRRFAWVYSKQFGLIELLEKEQNFDHQ